MKIAFLIWSLTAAAICEIGIHAWRSKEQVGFFTFARPVKVKDVTGYNHAVARLWFGFAVLFELLGLPLLWIGQNSVWALPMILCTVFLCIGSMVTYMRIEQKYKA